MISMDRDMTAPVTVTRACGGHAEEFRAAGRPPEPAQVARWGPRGRTRAQRPGPQSERARKQAGKQGARFTKAV